MTREEAKLILEAGRNPYHTIDTVKWCEAFEMAIEALDQLTSYEQTINKLTKAISEQEPCEDAISRQAVMDEIEFTSFDDYSDYLRIREKIEALPSVTPQEPTGHWIYEKRKRLINETDEGAEYITDDWCKCSKCGGDFGYIKMKDAFCKYCGAKMTESEEV